MPSLHAAAACLRYGFCCALVAIFSIYPAHASASTPPPVISGTPAAAIVAGQYYAFTPKVSGPAGYPLTFSISGQPKWVGFNRVSGQLLGTPTAASVGRYSNIIITVSDGVASASLPPFSITVTAAPANAPSISGTPAAVIAPGQYYAFTPKASAPNGYPLSFSISGQPKWAGFNRVSGQLLGTPTAANVGHYPNIVITANDGAASSSLPPFTITVVAASSGAPSISGTPAATIAAGSYYAFTPKVSGPAGYPLTFSISGQPKWVGFNRVSGQLLGTPTAADVGQYSNIVITVSDGSQKASLAPFSITVSGSAPQPSTGAVTINWMPPTENVDGSTLTNLAGYHLYYGTSQSSLTHVVNITNPGLATYVVSDLSAATYYFALTSVNANGTESPRSAVVSAVVQ